jgi:hypothetical protein
MKHDSLNTEIESVAAGAHPKRTFFLLSELAAAVVHSTHYAPLRWLLTSNDFNMQLTYP